MEKDLMKILVVDDTVVYRQLLSKIVSDFDNAEVIGTAPNGKIALSKIELKQPDLVLLDVFMPVMDGLETLDRIKKQHSHIDVVILSGMDKELVHLTMKALEAGALDFVPKPQGVSVDANIAELRAALSRLILMARTRKYSRQARVLSRSDKEQQPVFPKQPRLSMQNAEIKPPPRFQAPARKPEKTVPVVQTHFYRNPGRIDVVVIGVSTGGPNALQEIVPQLNGDFPVPILVVQHMPPMFTDSLAARLNSTSSIKVVEGKNGQRVENGVMYITPGGRHMIIKKDRGNTKVICLTDSPPVNSCRPSVDVLFQSVAAVYGSNVLSVILTGMGNDGVSGVKAIRQKGGYSIIQDEKSSVIWGMPGAVAEADEANEIVPLDRMAFRIMGIVKKGNL